MRGDGTSMWRRPFPWLSTTALCSGDERNGRIVDAAAEGVVRSKKGHFHEHDDGFASVRSRGTPHGDLLGVSGTTSMPLKGPKTVKMARPPHNSGSFDF